MATDDRTTFTREAFVAALTDYYRLLERCYISADAIKYAPAGGWPQLAPERLEFMDKSPLVLETLKFMPYIEFEYMHSWEIFYGAGAIDYSAGSFQKYCVESAAKGERPHRYIYNSLIGFEDECVFSEDVFWLTDSTRGSHGTMMFVDTARSTVTVMALDALPNPTELSQVLDKEERQEWRRYETWYVLDFFEHLKSLLRTGHMIPDGPANDTGCGIAYTPENYPWHEDAIKILISHGFGTSAFDKEICLPKLFAAIHGPEEVQNKMAELKLASA